MNEFESIHYYLKVDNIENLRTTSETFSFTNFAFMIF